MVIRDNLQFVPPSCPGRGVSTSRAATRARHNKQQGLVNSWWLVQRICAAHPLVADKQMFPRAKNQAYARLLPRRHGVILVSLGFDSRPQIQVVGEFGTWRGDGRLLRRLQKTGFGGAHPG